MPKPNISQIIDYTYNTIFIIIFNNIKKHESFYIKMMDYISLQYLIQVQDKFQNFSRNINNYIIIKNYKLKVKKQHFIYLIYRKKIEKQLYLNYLYKNIFFN